MTVIACPPPSVIVTSCGLCVIVGPATVLTWLLIETDTEMLTVVVVTVLVLAGS